MRGVNISRFSKPRQIHRTYMKIINEYLAKDW